MAEDRELIDRWRDGDQDAGNELFHRHFKRVNRFFRTKVPPEDVEDLIQRTFVGCVEGVSRFRGEASFRTYLLAIARRQLLKYIRDRVAHGVRVEPDLGVSSIAALGLSPSSAVFAKQQHQRLLEALRQLPVDHQTMLELFYWEGMSSPEIADVLGISHTTVRTRMHRARRALAATLATDGRPLKDVEGAIRQAAARV